jgi:hypothetical protein
MQEMAKKDGYIPEQIEYAEKKAKHTAYGIIYPRETEEEQ